VQPDGSPHDWLEGRGRWLTASGMKDDASGEILSAEFFPRETTEGYFRLMQGLFRRYGAPLAFYGDRSAIFVRNDDCWTREEERAGRREPAQFGRALEQLGITFIATKWPQAQGRVERLWGVLQDRLKSELRLAGAQELDSAKGVLRGFVVDYNRRFARGVRETTVAWRPAPAGLSRICALRHERVVSNDNVVQWEGRRFQIPPEPRCFSFAGGQGASLPNSRRTGIALLRRHPPGSLHSPRGDIFTLPFGRQIHFAKIPCLRCGRISSSRP